MDPMLRIAILLIACVLMTGTARAGDTLADAEKCGAIPWGVEQEGRAPYIFPSETDQETLVGFEVDLAASQNAAPSVPSALAARSVSLASDQRSR